MKKMDNDMLLALHHEDQAESWIRDNREKAEEACDFEQNGGNEAVGNLCTYILAKISDFDDNFHDDDKDKLKEFVKNASWRDVSMLLFRTLSENIIRVVDKKNNDEELTVKQSGILGSLILAGLVENKEVCTNNLGENNEHS